MYRPDDLTGSNDAGLKNNPSPHTDDKKADPDEGPALQSPDRAISNDRPALVLFDSDRSPATNFHRVEMINRALCRLLHLEDQPVDLRDEVVVPDAHRDRDEQTRRRRDQRHL